MSVERKIEIDSAGYASSFLQKYDKLRQEGRYCDFKIKAGDDMHQVHKTVLKISSEYFRAMLDHDTEENSQGFVIMKDVDASAVRKAVEFIYTGKASVRDDDIAGLIHVAYLMQLDVLCEGIGKLLADGISVESFYATKKFADMYKCKGLGNTCKQFAFRNFKEIVFIEEFVGLEEDYILALITSPSTKATEVRKYKAFKKWIDSDELNRRQCFSTMLRAIKVSKFPASFCRYIIENEPMVYKSVKCMQILTRSLFETFKVLSRDVDDDQNAFAAFAPAANSLMAYKVEDESWHEFCKMDAIMTSSTFTIINMDDIILAFRGDRKVFRLEYHNTGKAKWSEMQPMMYAHGNYPPVVACRQRAYVIGNSDNGNLASEVMDMTNNVWTEVAVTQQCNRRRYFSLCASENAILVIGGNLNQCSHYGYSAASNACDKLFESNDSWQSAPPMPRTRLCPSSIHNKGKIYVIGGFRYRPSGHQLWETAVDVYDTSANTWTLTVGSLSLNGIALAAIVFDTLYVVGSSRIFEHDAETNTWKEKGCTNRQNIQYKSGCIALTI